MYTQRAHSTTLYYIIMTVIVRPAAVQQVIRCEFVRVVVAQRKRTRVISHIVYTAYGCIMYREHGR